MVIFGVFSGIIIMLWWLCLLFFGLDKFMKIVMLVLGWFNLVDYYFLLLIIILLLFLIIVVVMLVVLDDVILGLVILNIE